MIAVYIYALFGFAFSKIKHEIQWILVPIFTAYPIALKWLYKTLSHKAAGEGKGKFSIKFAINHFAETRHAAFLAMLIGGAASPETTYFFLGLGFMINIYTSYGIIKKSKLGEDGRIIEGLVQTERIETVIPLAYMALMLMAFYGPNTEILCS